MDELFVKILPQIPPMGLMLVMVYFFLKAMAKRDEVFTTTMKDLHSEHLVAREASRIAIKENTDTIRHSTEKTSAALNKLNTTIEAIRMKSGL